MIAERTGLLSEAVFLQFLDATRIPVFSNS
jgi:hypothetical protein